MGEGMMNDTVASLLEAYVAGKDQGRPELLEEIYTGDARVTFAIETASISFPDEIVGNREIARVLSTDFNRKYDQVRTYYLSKGISEPGELSIARQGWLVLMREKENNAIRVGTGHYNWQIESRSPATVQIAHHHICIYDMLCLHNQSPDILSELQEQFTYPWLPGGRALEVLGGYPQMDAIAEPLQRSISDGAN